MPMVDQMLPHLKQEQQVTPSAPLFPQDSVINSSVGLRAAVQPLRHMWPETALH